MPINTIGVVIVVIEEVLLKTTTETTTHEVPCVDNSRFKLQNVQLHNILSKALSTIVQEQQSC